MRNPGRLIPAAFNPPNLPRKSIGRRAYIGLLIAATGATVLCGGSAAHSGPCGLANRAARATNPARGIKAGGRPHRPTVRWGLLHHQPTPDTVQNAERKANSDAAAALDRARQADVGGSAVACAKALDEAKHHWVIPPLS